MKSATKVTARHLHPGDVIAPLPPYTWEPRTLASVELGRQVRLVFTDGTHAKAGAATKFERIG